MRLRLLAPALLLARGLCGVAGAAEPPAEAVRELYQAKCQQCHMANGGSPLAPLNLADGKWKHGSRPEQVARVIAEGVRGSAMLPFKRQLTPAQIEELAAYVRSFDKSLDPARREE